MRSPLDKSATPAEKLDFIFSHICNSTNPATGRKNDEGGAIIDFSAAYMSYDHNYFGLNSYDEMKFYLDTLEEKGLVTFFQNFSAQRPVVNRPPVSYLQNGRLTFKGLDYLVQIEKNGILMSIIILFFATTVLHT